MAGAAPGMVESEDCEESGVGAWTLTGWVERVVAMGKGRLV